MIILYNMSEATKKFSIANQSTQSKIRNKQRYKTSQSHHNHSIEPSKSFSLKKQSRRYSEAQQTFNAYKSNKVQLKRIKPLGISSEQQLIKSPSHQNQQSFIQELHKKKNERIKEIYNPKGKSFNVLRHKGLMQKKKNLEADEEVRSSTLNSLNNKPYIADKLQQRKEELSTIVQESKKRTQTQKVRYKTQKQEYLSENNMDLDKEKNLPKFSSFYDTYSTSLQMPSIKREKCRSENENSRQKQKLPLNYDPHLQLMKKSNFDDFIMKKYIQGVYYGHFNHEKNIKQGKGVIFYKNGKLYEGQFKRDLKNGMGYELNPDGSYYEGQFINGMKNGKGKYEWQNGEVYDGQWENNLKHGSGLWQGEGSSYIGQWKNGIISGFGVLTSSKGERYEGQFHNFCKQGKGTFRFENGQIYVGEFYKNKPNGEGQYYWKNGDYYKGNFMNGIRHGYGIMKSNNGTQYAGQFRNDKKCGLGEQIFEDGVTYIGNYENDLRHGYGKIICDEVIYYDGYWLNSQAIDVTDTPTILQDERDMITSAMQQQKSQNSLVEKVNLKERAKEKVKKVIKNEIKHKRGKVQKSSSLNVLQRLYNPEGKKECKCMRKH